jgi:hypothetical protein
MVSGCADYDLGINFYTETSGEIVQRLRLNDRLSSFTPVIADQWFDQLQDNAKTLQGYGQRLGTNEFEAHIPFSSGSDLTDKFNRLFQGALLTPEGEHRANGPIPRIGAEAHLSQLHRGLAVQNHLDLDLDLRTLGVLIAQGESLINSDRLFDLAFDLRTPWLVEAAGYIVPVTDPIADPVVDPDNLVPLPLQQERNQVVWSLKPGEINHLEATFWLPSPVGLGAVLILALVIISSWLRARLLGSAAGVKG